MLRRRKITGARQRARLRLAQILVVALAFFIQGFITQTHIHGAPISDASPAAHFADHSKDGAPYDPFPASEDPVNQVYAGNYAAPAVALLVAPAERIAHRRSLWRRRQFVVSAALPCVAKPRTTHRLTPRNRNG